MSTSYRTISTEDGAYEEEHLIALLPSAGPLIGDGGDSGGKNPENSDQVGLCIRLLTVNANISGILLQCVFHFVFVSSKILVLVGFQAGSSFLNKFYR